MENKFKQQRILIVGGSSGIGFSIAQALVQSNAHVMIAGRSESKLNSALAALKSATDGFTVDITQPDSIGALFTKVGNLDHVAVTGPAPNFGPFPELDLNQVKTEFEGKFWGQWLISQAAAKQLPKSGSITLMSGAYSQRPVAGASSLAAVQAGIEGLVRGLALDLSPLRVNAVSPGLTDTPLIRSMFGDAGTQGLIDETAAQLPAQRVAQPEDIAEAYLYLIASRVTTGSVLFPDGGYTLR